ncbi:uncharacterized protein LOC141905249 [Tubulanus polymorphus]|uniref:uncharacterized protein LOC141905249 n=1 Tax=Tubulanus polymorphus TaxID=672921 RepID=UPI003DA582C4
MIKETTQTHADTVSKESTMKQKRDFGSFHSSNVEELIRMPESEYTPPFRAVPVIDVSYAANLSFGKEIKEKCFYLEPEFTFVNHGGFGGALKPAMEDAQAWQIYAERQPLRFIDRMVLPLIVHSTRKLSKLIGCDASDIVLVPNASTGMNAVIKDLDFTSEDTIYHLNIAYGGVKNMLKYVHSKTGAQIQVEKVNFPINGIDEIIELVDNTLKPGTKLAVFDHIPNNIPIILPVKELIEICHQRGVRVLIDGAHALGTLPLNLHELNPDYYISNCHKWFCSSKGCAFLYVAKEHQNSTHALVTSAGYGSGFSSDFIWTGLIDVSPLLSLQTVIDFWASVGLDKVRKYNHSLVIEAARLLVDKWNSKLIAPEESFGPMVNVQIPRKIYENIEEVSYEHAEYIGDQLYYRFQIEVPFKAVDGEIYVRISAHVYNVIEDYEVLADAIITLMNEDTLYHHFIINRKEL